MAKEYTGRTRCKNRSTRYVPEIDARVEAFLLCNPHMRYAHLADIAMAGFFGAYGDKRCKELLLSMQLKYDYSMEQIPEEEANS